MRAQIPMFPPLKRHAPRKLMHVCDGGNNGPGPGDNAQFECRRCGYVSEWMPVKSFSIALRGIPCPKCSGDDDKGESP
jgi:hypothetical protein